ncbi:MAG TPA: sigma-54 dependent transcriptional regulator, partial [Longimicrobiales bacterium]|nr:sigma-54 dependent transcriptional regulator [Longimicrobiales bacterium]
RLREEEDEIALILTARPGSDGFGKMRAAFDERIPRPPILACREAEGPEARPPDPYGIGVDETLSRPPDGQEVQVVLDQQLERLELQLETGIIGRTRAIRDVIERIDLVAPVKSTVLLTGESGTGKELVARAIHRYSPRRGQSFIAVNCAALPESLLESELFGHEKGAFTGATSRRRGMFELADGGTIFLDEIAEMPPPTQTRLLRVLEQRRFMRVGGDEEIEVNVRVIAATNQDLRRAVQAGAFRRDLYYRLNVLHLELPPLRDRKPDIPVLVRRFIRQFTEDHGREFKGLTADAMELLLAYDWPGNVRELRNLVESMVVLAPGNVIQAEDIPEEIRRQRGEALLPVRAAASDGDRFPDRPDAEPTGVEEMEFIFRTLIDLKMDVEDLRREFERYRERHPELLEGEPGKRGTEIEISDLVEADEGVAGPGEEDVEEETVIRFEPGMSMSELEREAIVATLKDVDGNRRKAAEALGIGERTLYRKLREYDIDL